VDKNVEAARKGGELQSLRLHPGYKVLINDIIFSLYDEAWETIKREENPISRAKLQAIEEILERIDDKINLANQLKEEYKRKVTEEIEATSY